MLHVRVACDWTNAFARVRICVGVRAYPGILECVSHVRMYPCSVRVYVWMDGGVFRVCASFRFFDILVSFFLTVPNGMGVEADDALLDVGPQSLPAMRL